MSADTLEAEDAPEEQGEDGGKKVAGKKLVLLVGLPLILVAVGAGLYLSGALGSFGGGETAMEDGAEGDGEVAKDLTAKAVFFDLPDMLVNLNGKGQRTNYLKLTVSLELQNEADAVHIEQVLPRVMDQFQVYLRELRLEDMRGSTGIHRLRQELLRRVNQAASPVKVKDVLFREMLVQ